MVEEQVSPPRRTLGDYVMYRSPRHYSIIAIPVISKALEINPNFLTLISTHPFTTMEQEDPYSHLNTFYELVGTIDSLNQLILKLLICVCFLFHWQERLRIGSNHFQIRASLARRM